MTWARVDDGFWCHPKIDELDEMGPAIAAQATGLWVRALSYCARRGDGEITLAQVRRIVPWRPMRGIRALVKVGLWDVVEEGKRWAFHDWSDYIAKPRRQASSPENRERIARESTKNRQRIAPAPPAESLDKKGTPVPVPDPVTTTPPKPPADSVRIEAQRDEWRSAIVRGWCDKHPGGFGSVTNDPALMPAVLACVEWHDRQPPGVDVDATVGGMLDRFFAAKSRYSRPRLAWLAEDVGQYIEPPKADRSRLPNGSRRKTFRQPPCQLTEADIDNSHSESIFGSVELDNDKPGPPSLRLVGGAK